MAQTRKIDSFIESDDEDQGFNREWQKINRGVQSDGFRTGLETSQDQALQTGFNAAFREAMKMALEGGKLQGAICASLNCSSNELLRSRLPLLVQKQDQPDSHSKIVTAGAQSASSPLQHLLKANTELISRIPTLLSSELLRSVSFKPADTNSQTACIGSSSDICYVKAESSAVDIAPSLNVNSQCTALVQAEEHVDQGDAQVTEQKKVLSCEHVCSDKSHFWNQLQSFKLQAQTFGVVSPND